jgi:hypothetical protein
VWSYLFYPCGIKREKQLEGRNVIAISWALFRDCGIFFAL